MPEAGFHVQNFLIQFAELLLEDLAVVLQPVFADVVDGVLVDVFEFQLQFQQLQQIVLAVRLVDALHQCGLASAFGRVRLAIRMQGAGEFAIDLADGQAQLCLLRLLPCLRCKLLCRHLPFCTPRFPSLIFSGLLRLLFFDSGMRSLQNFIRRTHVKVVTEFNAEHRLQRRLHLFEFGCRFAVIVGFAVPVVNGFQLSVAVAVDQSTGQVDDQLGDHASLGLGQAFLIPGLIEPTRHLGLQRVPGAFKRQELVDVLLLEGGHDALPCPQAMTPLFDLPDQVVECLLSFGQAGPVVGRRNADGLTGRLGHGECFSVATGHSPF
ncbi:hypothetical protein [Ralstonia pseudosolanacearum]|uniref:hypothetical protein n=1 Tax=Ralstonia pseudosolanacearum TaxID=1310165 RepID=UPI0018D02798|nr:hypothetical protein [Ralstonia pseudosolanacearum]UWD90012.1 hypothetical protein NY025_20350 [Ralstonia pseudosolanacearum]